MFAIQDEISQAIAEKLRVRLSEDRPLVKRYTENMEAYNLYLIGRYQFSKLHAESMAKSKEYFEQAIAVDPNYALAWHGLAMYYCFLGFTGFMSPKETNAQCRQATKKALELDKLLPQAHSMMAMLLANEFDWKEAELEFCRALELGPESTERLRQFYSEFYLVPLQRLDEAVERSQKAMERDPLSPLLQWRPRPPILFMRII